MNQNLTYLLIALQLADMASTYVAITNGKGTEGNAFLAKLFSRFGMLPTLLVTKGVFVGLLLWAQPWMLTEVLVVLLALYVWVLFNNFKVLLK